MSMQSKKPTLVLWADQLVHAELDRQFLGDPILAPLRMSDADAADELDVSARDARPADLASCRPAAPEQPEAATVPADDRGWLDDDEARDPTRPESGQQHPEQPVDCPEPGPLASPVEDSELLA